MGKCSSSLVKRIADWVRGLDDRALEPSELPAESESVFVLRVSLDGTAPRIWRQVRVPGTGPAGRGLRTG